MIIAYKSWTPTLSDGCFVAADADVIGNTTLGPQSSVWFHSVVRGDVHEIRIGARTNIQDLCTLHVTHGRFGLYLGDDITVGHRAVLHGCRIGDRCLIGIGAIVLDGANVEADCMIGAGAVVTPGTTIPSGFLALGMPAKPVRPISDLDRQQILVNAAHYVALAEQYRLMP
ncbi:MAG: gamma carbonic anhydrase family protein [Myxococcales bacterium]|nr:gamma carbonic anhydrase family protein [Myxococcales bacterium]